MKVMFRRVLNPAISLSRDGEGGVGAPIQKGKWGNGYRCLRFWTESPKMGMDYTGHVGKRVPENFIFWSDIGSRF